MELSLLTLHFPDRSSFISLIKSFWSCI